MSRAAALGVIDPPDPWVACWNCKDGLVAACAASGAALTPGLLTLSLSKGEGEASCRHDPPCPLVRCKVCGGDRGWYRQDAEAAR